MDDLVFLALGFFLLIGGLIVGVTVYGWTPLLFLLLAVAVVFAIATAN